MQTVADNGMLGGMLLPIRTASLMRASSPRLDAPQCLPPLRSVERGLRNFRTPWPRVCEGGNALHRTSFASVNQCR